MRLILRSLRVFASSAVLVVSLAGCGGDGGTDPDTSDVAGSWSGTLEGDDGSTGTLTLTLSETGGNVTGNGTLTAGSESLPLTVSGSYSAPDLTLTLNSPCCDPATLAATIEGGVMTGQLNGSGFSNLEITLTRD